MVDKLAASISTGGVTRFRWSFSIHHQGMGGAMDLVSADSKVLVVPWRAREVLDKRAAVFFAEKKGWGKSYIKAVYIQYILDIYIYVLYVYVCVCI